MSSSPIDGGGGGGGGSPSAESISTTYEVSGNELIVDVVYDAPAGVYSGEVTVSYAGGTVTRNIQQINVPVVGPAEPTVFIPLDELGVPEGEPETVTATVIMDGPDGDVVQQDSVEVTWGTPAVDITILNVAENDRTLDVTVSVSTETTATIDYTININETESGGSADFSGTLEGGSGSNPGDAVIHENDFFVGDAVGGLVTAQFTSPQEYVSIQDQADWGGGFNPDNVEISRCSTPFPVVSPGSTLNYDFTVVNKNDQEALVEVGFLMGGVQVGSNTITVGDTAESGAAPPEDQFREYGEEQPDGSREYELGVVIRDASPA